MLYFTKAKRSFLGKKKKKYMFCYWGLADTVFRHWTPDSVGLSHTIINQLEDIISAAISYSLRFLLIQPEILNLQRNVYKDVQFFDLPPSSDGGKSCDRLVT